MYLANCFCKSCKELHNNRFHCGGRISRMFIVTQMLTLLFTCHSLQPEHKPWSKNKAYQKRVSKIKGRRVDRQQEREKRRRIKEKTTSNQRDIDELMEDHKTLKLMKKRKVNKLKWTKGV